MTKIIKWDFTIFEPLTVDYLNSISCTSQQADRITVMLFEELGKIMEHHKKYYHQSYENKDYYKRLRKYRKQLEQDIDLVSEYSLKQFRKGN